MYGAPTDFRCWPACAAVAKASASANREPYATVDPRKGGEGDCVCPVSLATPLALPPDIFEFDGPPFDAVLGRRDPVGHLAGLVDRRLHQARDVGVVRL